MAEDRLIDTLSKWQELYCREFGNGIKKYDAVGHGKLGTSLKVVNQPKVNLFGQTYVMQIYAEPYWEQVNYGRGPSSGGGSGVLKGKIEEWLRLPNVKDKVAKGERNSDKVGSWSNAKYASVAWVIARKIHREGYDPRPFVSDARRKLDRAMLQDVSEAAVEEYGIKIEQIIQKIQQK
jgi:hypothetical protein